MKPMFRIPFLFCLNAYLIPVTCVLFLLKAGADIPKDTVAVQKLIANASSMQRSNVDSCYTLAQLALGYSEQLEYKQGSCRSCIQLCSVMIIKGENDSALYYGNQALALANKIGDHKRVSSALLLIGYVYYDMGNQTLANRNFYEALAFSSQVNDSAGILRAYTALGDFFLKYKDFPKAMRHFKNAYDMARRLNNPHDLGDALTGIASVYYRQDQFEQALHYYLQIDSLDRVIGSISGAAQNANNIALCYADLHQKDKALEFYFKALPVYKEQGMREEEANLYYNLACLYSDIRQEDSAIFYLQRSLRITDEIRDLEKLAQIHGLFARVYSNQGDFANAYQSQLMFSMYSDSLINSEKIASISEMETKYETQKKQQEIELLNQQDKIKNSQRNILVFGLMGMIVFVMEVTRQRNKAKHEKLRSDKLLLNILPHEVAEELKQKGASRARQYANVTVLFTDFVNFSGISQQMDPAELVAEIHRCFTTFDLIIEKHGLEKIKTIGDAYLAVSGLPNERADHAQRAILAAKEIREHMSQVGVKFDVRIGMSSGPVVAGIVGVKKYAYDIWGDTVNTAARMEQHSESGKINISGSTYQLVQKDFVCAYRGKVLAKNKGELDMYFVQ
jgi:class 3 adenylate cyclase